MSQLGPYLLLFALVVLAGYRWRLAVRMRRARQYVSAVAHRARGGRRRP